MTLDADIVRVAKRFGIDAHLIQAIQVAEGGAHALLRAVQCSEPSVTTREQVLDITCRSAVHRMSDFVREQGHRDAYVHYFASKWAPPNVANDPGHLNEHWPRNVLSAWRDG